MSRLSAADSRRLACIRTPGSRRDRTRARTRCGRAEASGLRRASKILATILLALAFAQAVFAQHTGDMGQAPPPPPGPGSLTVQVVGDSSGEGNALAGLPIALYALAPDGRPGLANGETDANGRYVFTGISNDPGIVYLVGARYAEIPFGERVTFAANATEARIEIRVSTPTDQVAGVRVEEIRARVDWMGDRVLVTEILLLSSAGQRVIQLPGGASSPSIFERPLPDTARDWNAGPSSIGDDLALIDRKVRFFGPLYPGEQRVEYQYSLPVAEGERTLDFPLSMREASSRIVLVAGTNGIEIAGEDLTPSRELADDGGQPLASWARVGLRGNEAVEIALTLPESRLDPALLSIPRADVWVDLDDTRLNANVELQLKVDAGPPVSGTPSAPLLHVTLPFGASLQGVAPESEAMGLVPTEDGGFDVLGPIGPGDHSLAYSYRIPSHPDGLSLGMRFPREIETLNVLIADTGLALSSDRLHRRRPFRNRTRNYLHREAYNVAMSETVDLEIAPLRATGLPQQASIALVVAAAAGAALFLITPLRKTRLGESTIDPELSRIRDEREAIYAAIADLEHDFETGKLDEADYLAMRASFKASAIDLLRAERAGDGGEATSTAETQSRSDANAQPIGGAVAAASESSAPPPTGAFCPSCGERVDAKWRFCSHCGGGLTPAAEDEATG